MKERTAVYIIDDDPSVRRALARLMRSVNIEVETFSCPEEFIGAGKRAANTCVIADIRMSGDRGFDLTKNDSLSRTGIPLIVLSASDDPVARIQARDLGAVAFFRKPVDDQALIDAILWAVAAPSAEEKTAGT